MTGRKSETHSKFMSEFNPKSTPISVESFTYKP